ncbi:MULTISPECIES: nitrate reductase molybdenum cofactor assembly chaperone [Kordiimonas]|jgi:nitrate reductase delta subunit|uniref:Respiratory nitrate reductase chaperone NarJ n=1 Tax=Kordiimonas lacus TaxID=637679 RepID=A0A1G7AA18_9PROT|nr:MULTISPECIES: nitrate reductase molybdenum cofactor assembly chaperone [Kordiimonas]SDE11347.1 respiratory nitrate reductase chaperone NarJ [Kordiimonas lacus]
MRTFKIMGMLLAYPTEDLQQHMDELKAVITEEKLIPQKIMKPLLGFMDDLARRNLMRVQEDYVANFDRSRAHSLYLFEHVHGESRDRGQAMVDLLDLYKSHGFELAARELPDYLPLFLEFLAILPFEQAKELLGETVHILGAVGAKLKAKKLGYQHVYRALEALSDAKADEKFVEQALLDAEQEDTSLEALDKEWEETPAFDGDASCAVCPSATRHQGTAGAAPTVQ